MQSVLTDLAYYHYQPATIDDEFSQKVYDLFMKRLDGNRRWLTQQDVAQLQAYQTQLDDDVKVGNYAFLDLAVTLQEQGINKTQEYYREFLSQPFDFTVEETYESDGEKKPFAKDDEELKEYWRKAMKFETMTRLADKVEKKEEGHEDFKDKTYEELEAEARKELLKVYDDWYKRLEKRKREDHVSMFLNCITNVFDPHSEYYQPIDKQNFDIGMSGRLEGIGARLQTDGDYTKVAEIIVGGPAWKGGELEADDLERLTGVPHEVDHIVQLVGKNKAGDQVISGLHVPWNLRAIPWKMNRMRGDWFYIAACERVDPNSDDEILAAF